MFSNKETLQERINELDFAIIQYTDDRIYVYSFESKDRLFDCFIRNIYCFRSQGVYGCHDINLEDVKENAVLIVKYSNESILFKDANTSELFNSKEKSLEFITNIEETFKNNKLTTNIIDKIGLSNEIEPLAREEFENYITEKNGDTLDTELTMISSNQNINDFDKILAIDFETSNEFHDKACSVGISLYRNNQIEFSKEYLINPESHFNDNNIRVHNITPDMVKDADNFPIVWKEVANLIDEKTLVIAHNAKFDISLLKKLIGIYKCEYTEFNYLCTERLFRANVSLPSYNLKSVAEHINGGDFTHHKAVDDALICLKAFLFVVPNESFSRKLIESSFKTFVSTFTIEEKYLNYTAGKKRPTYKSFGGNFKAKDLKPKTTDFDTTHPVYEKMFTFTGELPSFTSKKDAAQMIVDLGGIYKDGIVKANDYLVVGVDPVTSLPMTGSKVQKVYDYNSKGCNIQLIDENELKELLGIKSQVDIIEEISPISENLNKPTEIISPEFVEMNFDDNSNSDIDADILDTMYGDPIPSTTEEFKNIASSINNNEILASTSKEVVTSEIVEEQKSIPVQSPVIEEVKPVAPSTFKRKKETAQLSMFDMLGLETEDVKEIEDNNTEVENKTLEVVTNENTNASVKTNTSNFIKPRYEYKVFETLEAKLEKLKQYKLVSAKVSKDDKVFYYKGVYVNEATPCNIVGYLDLDVLVIEVAGNLHSIRGEYLKQMQDANFSIFEA